MLSNELPISETAVPLGMCFAHTKTDMTVSIMRGVKITVLNFITMSVFVISTQHPKCKLSLRTTALAALAGRLWASVAI